MDEFLQLNWGIKELNELDYCLHFIPEDEIAASHVFSETVIKKTCVEQTNLNGNIKQQQPVPGQSYNFKCNIKSTLNNIEQSKCLVALKLLQAGKNAVGFYEQNCMELYYNSLQEILQENAKFLDFVKERFSKSKNKVFRLNSLLKNYSLSIWTDKLNSCKHYKQFYKGIDMIPYSYKEDEEPVEMLHMQNVLELGTLAKFSCPTLLKPCHLQKGLLPQTKVIYNSKQSVSKDLNIDKLIETTKVNVVISSSGLTKLLNFTTTNTTWDIPIVVKEYSVHNSDNTTSAKKVVFIDKPFPNKSPSIFEFNKRCVKILLKTNFCDTEAFSFENTEPQMKDTDGNVIEKVESESEDILSPDCSKGKSALSATKEGENEIFHNVSYRLWKLQLKNEQCELLKTKLDINSIHVLVRSKLDGCETTENGCLQPINISPKVEYHLEYGAAIPSKDELVKEWVFAFFRPCSVVRRVRTHYNTGEIVSIESCTVQKLGTEAQTHYQYNLHLGLGVLYKVFSRLINLIPGNYLLRHLPKDGAFVSLFRETTESEEDVYNLHREYDVTNCKINPNNEKVWYPIDVNFILAKHNAAQQMPGMFKPQPVNMKRFRKIKKKKKRKIKSNASTIK